MTAGALPSDVARAMSVAGKRLGRFAGRVTFEQVVPSTNDVALRLAEQGAEDGTTVMAEAQTAGRGRQGHAWFSPPSAGLYFSAVLRDVPPTLVTLMAGVAVDEGIRSATGLAVELKWPNDVVVSDRWSAPGGRVVKVAGILTEALRTGEAVDAIIVGIGINVAPVTYPGDLAARASSLMSEIGRPVDRATVLVETLAALDAWRSILVEGGSHRLLDRWQSLAPSSTGSWVSWHQDGRRRTGVTEGVDPDGALRVRAGTRVERIVAGNLTWWGVQPPVGEGADASCD